MRAELIFFNAKPGGI